MIYIQSWKVSLITCLVHSSYVYQLHRTVIFPLGTRPGESAEPTKNKGQSTIWIAAGGGGLVFLMVIILVAFVVYRVKR